MFSAFTKRRSLHQEEDEAFEIISPSKVANKNKFHDLHGHDRLNTVVLELQRSCAWTQQMTPIQLTEFLLGECKELLHELAKPQSKPQNKSSIQAIKSEVGDCLFDALMLNACCAVKFKYDLSECFEIASEKVTRRTPYIELWGPSDGPKAASTSRECEAIWQNEKQKENERQQQQHQQQQQQNTPSSPSPSPSPSNSPNFIDMVNSILSETALNFQWLSDFYENETEKFFLVLNTALVSCAVTSCFFLGQAYRTKRPLIDQGRE